jgi:hypothetical protein
MSQCLGRLVSMSPQASISQGRAPLSQNRKIGRSLLSAPAQIRACPIKALGSHLGYLTAKRACGQG